MRMHASVSYDALKHMQLILAILSSVVVARFPSHLQACSQKQSLRVDGIAPE